MICSLGMGAMKVDFLKVLSILSDKIGFSNFDNYEPLEGDAIWILRFPRVIMASLVGAGLAIAGAGLQGLFKNPLADPGLIGVSAGASLSAAIIIVLLGTSGFILPLGTFIGAALTVFLIYSVSLNRGKTNVSTMLLAGIAFNAIAMSCVGYMNFLSDDDQLRDLTFWMMGSLGGSDWNSVKLALPLMMISIIGLPFLAKSLNIMALGDDNAKLMGVNVNLVKNLVIVLTTLAVGIAVCFTGVIGFLGLVTPHMIRMLFGPDHRLLLPASALLGSIMLIGSDLISRTLFAPQEIPVGIITAFIGAPVFLSIIIQQKKKFSLI